MTSRDGNQQVRVGIVGLGNMGGVIACRLIEKGRDVGGFDISPGCVERFVADGGTAYPSGKALAEAVDLLLTVLPNGPDVEAAFTCPDGILSANAPGLLCVDMSTIDPEVTRRVAGLAAGRGIRVIDAGIGGTTDMVANGQGSLMVGGPVEDLERARPTLDLLGSAIVHCGKVGDGVTTKLVNNLLGGVIFTATIEALLLGRKAGLDVDVMLKALSYSLAANGHLARTVPSRVLTRNFEPGFQLALMRKDADLALRLAQRLDVPLTLGAVAQSLRSIAAGRGLSAKDVSAQALVMEDLAGATLEAVKAS